MRFFFITLLYLFLLYSNSKSQIFSAESCGTADISELKLKAKPWFGNNKFLFDYLKKNKYSDTENNIMYRIPIKFWIYRKSNGEGGISEKRIKKHIKDLNKYYSMNHTGIRFYLFPVISYIDNNKRYSQGFRIEGPIQTFRHKEKGCINVLVVKDLRKGKGSINGVYNSVTDAVIIKQNVSTSTLSHEIGHFLGLMHPHRNWKKGKRKQESVSRTRKVKGLFRKGLNCENNGDALCDTPAEPNLASYTNNRCQYTGGNYKDNWGDRYYPNTNNIMSYTKNRECRNNFTKGQIAVMLYTASKHKYSKGWKVKNNSNTEFDAYEPDNTQKMASKIFFNNPQIHTFHKIYRDKKKELSDNTDWMMFEVKSKVKENIEISLTKSKLAFPKIKISIYDSYGKIIEKKLKNSISESILTGKLRKGKYYIKVEQLNPSSKLTNYKIEMTTKD